MHRQIPLRRTARSARRFLAKGAGFWVWGFIFAFHVDLGFASIDHLPELHFRANRTLMVVVRLSTTKQQQR